MVQSRHHSRYSQLKMPVKINTASKEELQRLPQIDEDRAKAIITLRDRLGNMTEDDLKQMPDIPATVWQPLLDQQLLDFTPAEELAAAAPALHHQNEDEKQELPEKQEESQNQRNSRRTTCCWSTSRCTDSTRRTLGGRQPEPQARQSTAGDSHSATEW